jgi:hypothetical protein
MTSPNDSPRVLAANAGGLSPRSPGLRIYRCPNDHVQNLRQRSILSQFSARPPAAGSTDVAPKERCGSRHNETLWFVPCASRPSSPPPGSCPSPRGEWRQGDERCEVTSRAGHNVSGIVQRVERGQEPISYMSTTAALDERRPMAAGESRIQKSSRAGKCDDRTMDAAERTNERTNE